MTWPDGKPYYSLNQYYKDLFGKKTYKIALDIGSTCPNRDGTLSSTGCIYCSAKGSGDYATGLVTTVQRQIEEAADRLEHKYQGKAYIAYLQSFTNTYGDTNYLLGLYREILNHPQILGLAIGTRPDCLADDLLSGLSNLAKDKPIWIELGLQTMHDDSANFINRCYPLEVFEDGVHRLQEHGLPCIVHLIAGLPTESEAMFLDSVRYISYLPIQGIKFHMLHVMKDTPLGHSYEANPFQLMDKVTYCQLICDAISLLPNHMVIHRLTGDAPQDLLIEPQWTGNKRNVLNTIHKTLKAKGLWQGMHYDVTGGNYERK